MAPSIQLQALMSFMALGEWHQHLAGQLLPTAAPGVSRDRMRGQQTPKADPYPPREGKANPCTIWDFKLILSAQLTGLPALQTAR